MSARVIALYAGGPLGPDGILTNLAATKAAGWTTIILSLFHIGRPQISGQRYGDIIFNGAPMVISQGAYKADPDWPTNVAQLKQGGSITSIYASFGGGSPVEDFATIQTIYEQNGNSFSGTEMEQNFRVFRETFPAIDGIDLDCEDNYDQPSFVAFCEMLAGIGFSLTFCPYDSWEQSFWVGSLAAVDSAAPGAVKWWNLQCYDGGGGNDPAAWARAISESLPGFPVDGFIVAGDWTEGGPSAVEGLMARFAGEGAVGGGFIWNMDDILGSSSTMADFVTAIQVGLGAHVAAEPPDGPPTAAC